MPPGEWDDELVQVARRYARILEHGPIGVFEVQLDGTIRFANTAVARLAGFERPEELIGQSILPFHADPAQRQEMLAELMRAGSVSAFPVTLRSVHGQFRRLLLSVLIDGDVLRGMSVDVTDVHEKEAELQNALELNRRILDVIPGGVVHVLSDGSITHANAEALRVLGLSHDELTRRYTRDFDPETIHEDGTHCPVEHYPVTQALLTGQEPPPHTLGVRRPDGGVSWAVFRATPVRNRETGQVVSAVVTFFDISERKHSEARVRALEEQVRHAQKLESLGLMAGGVAHDFNNLLAAIMGNAGLARLQLASGGDVGECIEAIEATARRAAELTRQMLTYAGGGKVEIKTVSLSSAVREMAELLATVVSKRATLGLELDDVPPIEADATQIHQVVMNLILNASDALAGVGAIHLRTGLRRMTRAELSSTYVDDTLPAGDYVFLEVSDTGHGMDEETKRRVFDPFFTTKATGRGLGLAATLGIVRGHKGAIEVVSAPNRGTTMRVFFPRAEPRARSGEYPRAEPVRACRGTTVLVVDDERSVRDVTKRLLEECGYTVLTAEDGKSALGVFAAHQREIHVVLLDLTMGDMSGLEVLSEMDRLAPGQPVVLASGYSADDVATELAGRERVRFLQKPFSFESLVDALERVRAVSP